MKKVVHLKILLILLCFFMLFIDGCRISRNLKLYSSIDAISKIEIVFAKDPQDYEVLLVLKDKDEISFLLSLLDTVQFYYVLGDPSEAFGRSIRINYIDGVVDYIGAQMTYLIMADKNEGDPILFYQRLSCNLAELYRITDPFLNDDLSGVD